MFYNERVTTDATPSVKIYEGNQGQAMMKEGAELKKQASNEMQEAKKMEQTALELGISKGMNELWQNEALQSNPKALAEEMDKLAENVTSKTTDTDLKVKVLADFQLKKDSYINNSITKMRKIQEEKRRSATFDSIYSNIDSLSRAWGNVVSGEYTPEDEVNFQYSRDRIIANINARNPDGTYVFSDAQRRALSRDADQAIVKGFESIYDELPEEQQNEIYRKLNDGTYRIANFRLGDVVGDIAQKDIKRSIERQNQINAEIKDKQNEENAKSTLAEFFTGPSDFVKQKLVDFLPALSEKSKKQLDEVIETKPDLKATTDTKKLEELDTFVNKYANNKYTSYEKAIEDGIDMISKVYKENSNKKVSKDDADAFKDKILTIMRDEAVQKGFQELAKHKDIFWEKADEYTKNLTLLNMGVSMVKEGKESANKQWIENLAQEGTRMADGAIMMGKPEEAKKILAEYRKKIIYASIPELEGKKPGDKFVRDGIVYEVTSDESLRLAK